MISSGNNEKLYARETLNYKNLYTFLIYTYILMLYNIFKALKR